MAVVSARFTITPGRDSNVTA